MRNSLSSPATHFSKMNLVDMICIVVGKPILGLWFHRRVLWILWRSFGSVCPSVMPFLRISSFYFNELLEVTELVFCRKFLYAHNGVNCAFLDPNLHFGTFLEIYSLYFSEIVPENRHWKVSKSKFFCLLRKILIIPKMGEMGHFWAGFSLNLITFFWNYTGIKQVLW